MPLPFQGRHIVVTGASGALGTAVANALLEAGAICHLPSRGQESTAGFDAAVLERVQLANGVDPTNERAVVDFYAGLPSLWASIHCIGGFAAAPLAETLGPDVERLMQANFLSPFFCSREAVRAMRRGGNRGGRIVNVAARAALEPRAAGGMAAYAASKAALAALSEALGEELAAEGILVNSVAPSLMDTPANRKSMPNADHARWPRVEEVAATILWLASPENALVRSGIVPVYGRS